MIGQFVKKVAWWTFVAMACLALWRGLPQEPSELYGWAKQQEAAIKSWYKSTVGGIQDDIANGKFDTSSGGDSTSSGDTGGTGEAGGAGGTGSAGSTDGSGGGSAAAYTLPATFTGNRDAAQGDLDAVTVADSSDVAYNRDEWNHWISAGTSCWNVREEVLYRDAQPDTIVLADKSGAVTKDKGAACSVKGGAWNDPYTGTVITDPGSIDIDHLVPLGEAAKSGGQAWDADRKQAYANNLDDPTHLVAVSASANRAKGDKDPGVWKPSNEAAWCGYATAWVHVKAGWGLTADQAEKDALQQMLDTCA